MGDEVLTPDSSRFWAAEGVGSPAGRQESFDKQYVRNWLDSPDSGWDRVRRGSRPRRSQTTSSSAPGPSTSRPTRRLTGQRFE